MGHHSIAGSLVPTNGGVGKHYHGRNQATVLFGKESASRDIERSMTANPPQLFLSL
jgi:hypothetical protein